MESKIKFGILTVSDSCSGGKAEDTSGDNLEKIVNKNQCMLVAERSCVPDDYEEIKEFLIKWSDVEKLDVILTTGGTGFGHRDITPEATLHVLDKDVPGIASAMLVESLKITPFAMLSRAVCGIRKKTMIINLPGSKKGSAECLAVALSVIPHAVSLLRNKTDDIKTVHSIVQGEHGDHGHSTLIRGNDDSNHIHQTHSCAHSDGNVNVNSNKSQVDISKVARRPREQSEFPMIDFNVAVEIVLEHTGVPEIEKIDLRNEETRLNVVGRILAENVVAVEPFPPFPASTKDGYAVKASDNVGVRKVIGDRVAGSSPDLHSEGEFVCVRVSTGAPVPRDMDAVVMVEDTELVEEADEGHTEVSIKVLKKPNVGENIRCIGFDIKKGQLLLEAKTVISSTELGLFATLGINEISVYKLPKIGVLSTGDELIEPWNNENPKPGCIRDSNKTTLMELLKEKGFHAIDCGIARDNPDDVYKKMSHALEKVDVLISSGSVSMGERDLIKHILKTDLRAKIHFGTVNMKPGKPMTFATCKGPDSNYKLVFALPGNSSSAVVTTHVFVLPALRKLAGSPHYKNTIIPVKLLERFDLDGRPELKRAILYMKLKKTIRPTTSVFSLPSESDEDYEIVASTTGNQESSRLASLKGANGLICLPSRTDSLKSVEIGVKVNAYLIGTIYYEKLV